jgi:hypothetical protein
MKILKWCRVVLPAACLCAAGAARAATLTAGPFAVEVSPVLTVRCHDELLFSGERCGVFPNPRSPATPWIDVAAVGKVVRQDNCLTVSAQNGRNSFRREVLVTPEAVHVTFEMKAFGQTGGTHLEYALMAPIPTLDGVPYTLIRGDFESRRPANGVFDSTTLKPDTYLVQGVFYLALAAKLNCTVDFNPMGPWQWKDNYGESHSATIRHDGTRYLFSTLCSSARDGATFIGKIIIRPGNLPYEALHRPEPLSYTTDFPVALALNFTESDAFGGYQPCAAQAPAGQPFHWEQPETIRIVRRAAGGGLRRDFAQAKDGRADGVLELALRSGLYLLTLNVFDAEEDTGPFSLAGADGPPIRDVRVAKGQFWDKAVPIRFHDGKATLRFSGAWKINALTLQVLLHEEEDFILARPYWNMPAADQGPGAPPAAAAGGKEAARSTVVLAEDFGSDAWQQRLKQGPGGAGNVLQRTSVAGRTALLLYDNDAQSATALDVPLALPPAGRVSGFVLIPSQHAGAANGGSAYFAIQLLGGAGSPRLVLSGQRSNGTCGVVRQVDGKKAAPIELPGVLADDVWVPWQIAWEWDGSSAQGRCRVAVFDQETDPFPFDAAPLTLLRVVSGWSTPVNNAVLVTGLRVESDAEALGAALPDEVLRRAPFAVTAAKAVLADTFATADAADADVPQGWYHWKPDGDPGRFVFDHAYGRRDLNSVCLDGTRSAVWQKKVPARPGARYRFSAWVRAEQAEPNATLTVSMQGRGILKATGREGWIPDRRAANQITVQPGYWQYLETFWAVPESGEYPEGSLTLVDVEFLAQGLKGKAWCDDVRLDEVAVTAPWRDDFGDGTAARDAWRVFAFHGLEGQAEVVHAAAGFADGGALQVNHLRGQTGFSAARLLPRETFAALREWALLVQAMGLDEGVPAVNVQQLDDKGEILSTTGGKADAAVRPGWRELRVAFVLQPRTAQVRLLLTNNGKGSAVFDNAWLRPAQADEIASTEKALPVMFRVFPADVVAAIDRTPAVVTIPAGQAGAFNLHLYGDRESKAQTRVEIEAPDWLVLRTAQMACYGEKPLEPSRTPAKQAGRSVFTFTDPYPWQGWQMGAQPNTYTGLFTVWRADAKAGVEDTLVIRTFLGEQTGEARTLKLAVRPPIAPAPELKEFAVGIWGLAWLNVRDAAAQRELLRTYVDAGVRRGSMHETHGYAAPVMAELGFKPALAVMADLTDPVTYRALPEAQRPPLAVTFEGQPTQHFIALGAALNDPAVHAAYKARLKQKLRGFPDSAADALADIEFWGDGGVSRSDFHPSTIAEFRQRAKIPADQALTPAVIVKEHYAAWSRFRNDLTAELHGRMRQFLQELRPGMKLWAYDYPLATDGTAPASVTESPMNSLLYEPYVDGHLVSTYNIEGAQFLDTVDNAARHLKKPVWTTPFLMKNIDGIYDRNYNYAQISARELRFELVGAAASGARGHLGFPGQLMDADYLHAYAEGVTVVATHEDLYLHGERQDALVRLVEPPPTVRHRVHVLGGKRLLTLFNGGVRDLEITWECDANRQTTPVAALDVAQVEIRR